ncbi:MAG: glycosyltransferase [Desulfosarcinaceae bacterium]
MHILVFEPRLEGHHLSWLRYITEDFLCAGHRLTLAIDGREAAEALYREHLAELMKEAATISVYDRNRRFKGGNRLSALDSAFIQSRADQAFVNNLDDIASSMFRRAALGLYPPPGLKGKLSGVYFRPRFLANARWPLGNIPKKAGFRRLMRQSWFHSICLLDEYLHQRHAARWPEGKLVLLPDTWSGSFTMEKSQARRALEIAPDRFVLLHYGIGTRRKGLHLVLRAIQAAPASSRWHLLCAGKIADDPEILQGIRRLTDQGRATVLNRYVSKAEEQRCFAACDVVLLPYVHHFGSSGVLSLAAAAKRMVVASNEGLVARRVEEKSLGLCFPSGDVQGLESTLARAENMLKHDPTAFDEAAGRFAAQCDRAAFRNVLRSVYPREKAGDTGPVQ